MTEGHSYAALWARINTLNDEVIRIQERSKARDTEMARLENRIASMERWIARALMIAGSLGTGAAYIIFKQMAEAAGISL
jgi:type II secretory pathway component PulJ